MTFRLYKLSLIIRVLIFSSAGVFIAVSSFFLMPGIDYLNISLSVLMGAGFLFLFSIFVVRRIKITESGMEYITIFRRTFRNWDDIKYIGLGCYPPISLETLLEHSRRTSRKRFFSKLPPLLIYFTEDCETDPDGTYAISRAFIRVFYRKEIVEEILKYYSGEIIDKQFADVYLKNK